MDIYNDFEDIYEKNDICSVLEEFKKSNGGYCRWNLISPVQYKKALQDFSDNGDAMRFPERILDGWFHGIVENIVKLDSITKICGHKDKYPYEEINSVLGAEIRSFVDDVKSGKIRDGYYKDVVESGNRNETVMCFLEWSGFFKWAVLTDGSVAVTDFGLLPMIKIAREWKEGITVGEKLMIINRIMNVTHCNGDLSAMFIKGGKRVLDGIESGKGIFECKKNGKMNILEESLDEMAVYPENFSLDVFKNIKTFKGRVEYCNSKLEKLGSGSSRIAYKIDNETVLKLAKNRKGVAQNEVEVDVCGNGFVGCAAKVFEYDENYKWLEMQLVRKAKKSDFQRITGKSFEFFCDFIDYAKERIIGNSRFNFRNRENDLAYEELISSENYEYSLFYYIWDYIGSYGLEIVADLKRISSWGVAMDENGEDELLLIDAGLNDNVYETYYSLSESKEARNVDFKKVVMDEFYKILESMDDSKYNML